MDLRDFFIGKSLGGTHYQDLFEQALNDLDSGYTSDMIHEIERKIVEKKQEIETAKQQKTVLEGQVRVYRTIIDKMESVANSGLDVSADFDTTLQAFRDRMEDLRTKAEDLTPTQALREKFLLGQQRRRLLQRARAAARARDVLCAVRQEGPSGGTE